MAFTPVSSTEFGLIETYFAEPARRLEAGLPARVRPLLGIGDDCALLEQSGGALATAVSTDMLIEGRHFFPDVSPRALGHKALAVNLSDLAAIGARPRGFTLALALPEADPRWLEQFSQGLFDLAVQHACPLVGGDTTRGPLAICITVFGDVDPGSALRRDRAKAGDTVWVSGTLGGAAWAVEQIRSGKAPDADHPARRSLEWPQPRVQLGAALASRGLAHAAIDISDGLGGDLRHLLARSGLPAADLLLASMPWAAALDGLTMDSKIALAVSGGDDYELLFTAPPAHAQSIQALGAELGIALTAIGAIADPLRSIAADAVPLIRLIGPDGVARHVPHGGYDHFRESL